MSSPGVDHDCPVQLFIDDPITQAYGLAGDLDEWGPLLVCRVCSARQLAAQLMPQVDTTTVAGALLAADQLGLKPGGE